VILLDTHVVLWLAFEGDRLSLAAKSAIHEARKSRTSVAVSSISLLEISTLARKGRIYLELPLEIFLHEVETRFTVLPITARACARTAELPANYPEDPADRIIGATALVEAVPLLTSDREIRQSKALTTIW
jgi:PIN domain nuclease of toxin-antitoxin system